MKLINIKCFDNGSADLTTSDFHISSENKASKLVIDFEGTSYSASSKWVDLIMANGTSLRYELGNEPIVELELQDEITIAGMLTITPFVIEGDKKIKYMPRGNVVIKRQADAGDIDAPQRDDYIFNVVKNVTSHIADNNNPHNVTKEQIGLGNVNNTSDADKPISTAQQTKFDLLDTQISNLNQNKVNKTTTINGKKLDDSIILTKNDFADLNNVNNTSDADKPISTATLEELNKKISLTEKGIKNGVATLNELGKVPSSQLPSFVDDVVEGYLYNGKFYQDAEHQIELSPETSKIYVDKITNNTFRWGGSQYIEISQSLALGETENTAFRGDRGKIAYDKSIANEEAINENLDLINGNHIEVNNRIDSVVNENIAEIEFTEPITYIEDAIIDAPQEIMEIKGKSEVIITDEDLKIASVVNPMIESVGKNLFNAFNRNFENKGVDSFSMGSVTHGLVGGNIYSTSELNTRCRAYFKGSKNKTYHISVPVGFIANAYFEANDDGIITMQFTGSTFTITNETLMLFTFKKSDSGVFANDEISTLQKGIQIEEGTTATPYEPYQSHELQFTGEYKSIPATTIKDRIINDNGVYYDEINTVKVKLWEYDFSGLTDLGNTYRVIVNDFFANNNLSLNYTWFINTLPIVSTYEEDIRSSTRTSYGALVLKIEKPLIQEIMTRDSVDEVTALKTYLEENHIMGVFQLAEPIVKQSEVAIMDDLIFKQGHTIYLSSEQLAPTMLAKCAYNLGAQVKMLVDDSRNQAKSIEENKDNIANLQSEVNKFVFVSETEFESITKEDGKVYGVYNEETGIITWYYGNIGGG